MFKLVAFKIHAILKRACFNWLPWTSTGSSHCEMFLEINLNQKALKFFTSWMHWKNQCKSTLRKHAVMEQALMSTLAYLLKISSTHFMTLKFFYTSWNTSETSWNTSENQMFPDLFKGHWRRPVPWNGLRVF